MQSNRSENQGLLESNEDSATTEDGTALHDPLVEIEIPREASDANEITLVPANTPTPLPKKEMFVLMCIVLAEGFTSAMLLPFIAFMVIDFGIPELEVGYYAGFITSSFFAAQLLSSFFWGYLSDIRGRRLVLLVGLLGNIISSIAFGISKSLLAAVISRSIAGLLNGSTGVVKSYIREITDPTNQAKGYILRSAGYALGATFGTFLGGVLARPAIEYPSAFSKKGLFGEFPYLLPCLVAAVICLVGFVTGYFFLKETNPNLGKEWDEVEMEEAKLIRNAVLPDVKPRKPKRSGLRVLVDTLKLFDRYVYATVMLFSVATFVWLCFDEVFGVWALRSPEEGGINFSTTQIGLSHAFSSISMLLMQIFIYVPLERRLGSQKMYMWGMILWGPVLFLIPFTNNLTDYPYALWPCLLIGMGLKNAIGTASMAAINILINNCASSKTVGMVNGLSTSTSALARLFAPTFGGSVFAATSASGMSFPLNFHFIFILLAISCIIEAIVIAVLPKSINQRKL